MKKNIGKSRLQFWLLSLVLVTGVFNLEAIAEGPGCMPTGIGGCPGVSGHPMATLSINGVMLVASSLNATAAASGTGKRL